MTIESQVCTLKQSKNLKKLGVKQDSLFYWIDYAAPHGPKLVIVDALPYTNCTKEENSNVYSAFTGAELILMIGSSNGSFNPTTATLQFAYELIGELAMHETDVEIINSRLISV